MTELENLSHGIRYSKPPERGAETLPWKEKHYGSFEIDGDRVDYEAWSRQDLKEYSITLNGVAAGQDLGSINLVSSESLEEGLREVVDQRLEEDRGMEAAQAQAAAD